MLGEFLKYLNELNLHQVRILIGTLKNRERIKFKDSIDIKLIEQINFLSMKFRQVVVWSIPQYF